MLVECAKGLEMSLLVLSKGIKKCLGAVVLFRLVLEQLC